MRVMWLALLAGLVVTALLSLTGCGTPTAVP